MATANKTPVAAKKVGLNLAKAQTAEAAADKPKAKPADKPKVKFKLGQEVIGTSATGAETKGRYAATRDTHRGLWIDINISPKGKPAVLKGYRPKAVRAA